MKRGFDTEKYLMVQSSEILKRVDGFDKLYLEFGGKICDDLHAARVLPGYDPNTKIRMLNILKDNSEIIFCISAKDIENGRIRGDFGINYEAMTLKTINDLKSKGLEVSAVVINRFSQEKKALQFKQYLNNIGIKVYLQKEIEGYPSDVNKIVSSEGYGQNPYIKTNKKIIVVTGVAPGSGKMSFCLSQMYHDFNNGLNSGFAKFETFPIWNLEINHPVNIAYEAATADIGDVNMIDPFHLSEYNITSVNYNRDIENFPILKRLLQKIEFDIYKSPTEMGVSKAKEGIYDNEIVSFAAKQEVIRRYFRYKKEFLFGIVNSEVLLKMEKIMQKLNLNESDRRIVPVARETAKECFNSKKGNKGFYCGCAIELNNGRIITGKNSSLLHAESAALLNSLKVLSNLPDDIHLIPENFIENINKMKKSLYGKTSPSLNVSEVLILLAILSSTNPIIVRCLENLNFLKGCEMHTTHLPSKGDEEGIRNLGINLTTDTTIVPNLP